MNAAWMLWLLGCAAHRARPAALEQAGLEGWTVSLAVDAETSGALALPPMGLDVELDLRFGQVRRFRDGSLGMALHARSEAAWLRQGEQRTPLEPPGLAGRTVELRTFPDGEILAVNLADHWVGPDRYGDVLDLLFPLLSPAPPALEEGAEAARAVTWQARLAGGRAWRGVVDAVWHNAGQVTVEGVETWHLTWRGPWRTQGRDGTTAPPLSLEARGEVSGEVWIATADLRPVRAEIRGERALHLGGLTQVQRLQATATRRPAREPMALGQGGPVAPTPSGNPVADDAAPLPRYLEPQALRASLVDAVPAFDGCLTAAGLREGAGLLEVRVGSDGRASALTRPLPDGRGGLEAAAGCLAAVAEGLAWPPHDEAPVVLRWPLVAQAGQLLPYPTLDVVARPVTPLLLLLPPLSAPLEAQLRASGLLGLAEGGGEG